MASIQEQELAEQILTTLDAEDGGESADAPAATPEAEVLRRLDAGDGAPDQDAGETAADTTTEVVEPQSKPETAQPEAIEPPASWKAEEKERFKALPPDLQKYLADRESERDRGLSKSQQESADARKAAEAERATVQAARQAHIDGLNQLVNELNTIDPVIAEGRKLDWVAELRSGDPTAAARHLEYQQREGQLAQRAQQRNFLLEQQRVESFRSGHEELSKRLDFWTDEGKRGAFQQEFGKYLVDQGFKPEEASNIDDWRAMVLGRKAMLYDQLMAQQAKIVPKKPVAPKTMPVQAANEVDKGARAEALKRTAIRTGRTEDVAAAVLASL